MSAEDNRQHSPSSADDDEFDDDVNFKEYVSNRSPQDRDDFDDIEEEEGEDEEEKEPKKEESPTSESKTSPQKSDTQSPIKKDDAAGNIVKDQPFDEVVDAGSESDDVSSPTGGKEKSDDSSESDDGSEEEERTGKEYNSQEFAELHVSREIKDLFTFISGYKPQDIEIETKLKPFIPEYIPAVGDIDPFLKVPPPDSKPDYLGLKTLDEPGPKQSDPLVVKLDLTYRSRDMKTKEVQVKSVENAHKNPKLIQAWIDDLQKLHKKNPPQNVKYSKPMPDVEELMKVWPDEYEELLQSVELPTANLEVDLETYIKIICTLLDIPVYENITESLHVLFTLYSEFKENQHFNQTTNV